MAIRLLVLFTLAVVSHESVTCDSCQNFHRDQEHGTDGDSNDWYCKTQRTIFHKVDDSDILRLNFAGRFLADTATYNNDRENFNISTFDPLRNPDWNPQGTGEFRLVNCTVTQVCLADGHCGQDDPVVGQPITGNDITASAKMVDLDPDTGASQLWGLVVGVGGFFKGGFVVRSFNHQRDACEGSDCGTVPDDTRLAAVWLSTLEKVQWIEGPLVKKSGFIQQLMSLKCKGQDQFNLYVKFSVYNMIVDPKSPDFGYGRVIGTIFAVVSDYPLPYGPYKRMLWRDDHEGGHVPFYVDVQRKRIVLDFANSVKFDIKGNVVEPTGGRLFLVVSNLSFIEQGCDILNNDATNNNLGEIRHYGNDWFQRTGGIIELSVKYLGTIGQLAIIQQMTSTRCKTVLKERLDGLFVDAIDKRIWRTDPDIELTIQFRTFMFGVPAEGIKIATRLIWPPDESNPALTLMESESSNMTGISKITLNATDPGEPRKEQQLDGQVYTFSIIAWKEGSIFDWIEESISDWKKGGITGENLEKIRKEFQHLIVKDLKISVHVYSDTQYPEPPEEVKWYDHVYPIFQQYANLFPVMKPIINLASYEDVTRKKKLLKLALCLPETDPNYMPVTRDLSPKKREMILRWLDALDQCPKPPTSGGVSLSSNVDELKQNLQIALQLELSTIPPYLSALFSIKDGYNTEVAALIKSVVVEEMKHMTLVSNILNAIGGAPVLNKPSVVSSYPAPLPAGANPGLVVTLAKCSLNQIRTVFQGIERPNCDMANSDVIKQLRHLKRCLIDPEYDHPNCKLDEIKPEIKDKCDNSTTKPQTIGAIYIHQILCPMIKLWHETKLVFNGTGQINSDQWHDSSLAPIEVKDIRTALTAIVDIISEGEGSDPYIPFDLKECELSHFFKFAEVVHGRKLIVTDPGDRYGLCFDRFFPCDDDKSCTKTQCDGDKSCTKTQCDGDKSMTQCDGDMQSTKIQHDNDLTFCFAGRPVPFFEDGVWPTISNPHTKRYPPGSQVRKYSDRFNKIYTGLLRCLHEAFNGKPKMMNHCMGMMPSLTAWGKKLVRTPIDPNGDPEIGPNAAPTFEFYVPSD